MVRRLLVPALSAALLVPGSAALADTSAPVEVTAAVRTADGRLAFVTERASSRVRGLELAQRMRSRARVVAASVATPVRALADDPLRARQWGLTTLSAEQTWAQGPASGTLVAVVDTGVDGTHPDLEAVTVPGLDLVGTGDGRTDPHGHGTHVAGVVAAVNGNGIGGAGLAQGARVLPVRALAADGSGYDSAVAKGIAWAVDHGAKVVNLSLGGDRPSSLLNAAIDYAHAKGVVVVAAAGNAGAAGDPVLYPAATRGVVAVGAVASDDSRPAWSSSGSHLAVAAPGVGILSTVPGARHATWNGTSMAAPFVAAAAALVLSDEPQLTPAAVRQRLMDTARDVGAPGPDSLTGAGVVDVVKARVTRPLPAKAAPVVAPTAEPAAAQPAASQPAAAPPAESQPAAAAPAEAAPVAPEPVVAEPVAPQPAAPQPAASEPQPAAPQPAAPQPEPQPVAPQPQPVAPQPEPQPARPAETGPVVSAPAPVEPAPAPVAPQPVAAAPGSTAPVAGPRTDTAPVAAPTVTVFPSTISAGQRVTVTYRGTPGAVVDVLSRTQPATAFSRIATVTLGEDGTATSTHAPQKSTRITARSASGQLSATQPIVAVRSVASLTVSRTGTRTYAFTGRVYPALDQRLVSLYRGGVLVAQGRTDASGVYRIVKQLAAGASTFQARTPDDQHNLGAASPLRRALVS